MMKNGNALIAFISRLRIGTDGKGIRTLVGFYNCPLRCQYCLNPKTISEDYSPVSYTPSELLDKISLDHLYFITSQGGITFGGGEPLLYPDFIKEFINLAPREWNYVVETSLNVPYENIEKLIDVIDGYIIDVKTINNDIYHQYTSRDNKQVLDNLNKLLQCVPIEKIMIRLPYIPHYTDEEDYKDSYQYLKQLGIKNIDQFQYVINRR